MAELIADGWDDKEIGRPAILRLGDAYWMWYSGCDSHFERAIGLAHSNDGVSWQRFGPGSVLAPPVRRMEPGYHSLADPWVVQTGGRFVLVATAQGGSSRRDLVSAASVDGIDWSPPAVIAAAPEESFGYGAPGLAAFRGRFLLAAFLREIGTDGATQGRTLRLAWSDDLARWAWEPRGVRALPNGDLDHPCLVAKDDRVLLFCSRYANGRGEILRAESPDGVTWSPFATVLTPGPAGALDSAGVFGPCVLREDGGYTLWHLGASQLSDGYRLYVLRAVSADGSTWRRDPDRPVFRAAYGAYLNPF